MTRRSDKIPRSSATHNTSKPRTQPCHRVRALNTVAVPAIHCRSKPRPGNAPCDFPRWSLPRIAIGPLPKLTEKVQIPQYRKCHYVREDDSIDPAWIERQEGKSTEVHLLTNAMFLKHYAFNFEREHRLFFHPMPSNQWSVPIEFNGNKPFIAFNFDKRFLKQIYVSPRGNKRLTERTVRKVLDVKGLSPALPPKRSSCSLCNIQDVLDGEEHWIKRHHSHLANLRNVPA